MVKVISILFCFSSIIFTVTAEGEGCTLEETGKSQNDCMRYLDRSGLSTDNNPQQISFLDHLTCIRVLNLNCEAVLGFQNGAAGMIQVVVDYNGGKYYVNAYKDEAKERLEFMEGGDDDDDEEEDK